MEENKIATRLFGILVILFRPHVVLGVISKQFWSQILHDNPQWIGKETCFTCFSSEQNGNHLYEMHDGDIIFSANQGDSSMEDEDFQAKENQGGLRQGRIFSRGGRFSDKRSKSAPRWFQFIKIYCLNLKFALWLYWYNHLKEYFSIECWSRV